METKQKKVISVMVPCYNEEENVVPISKAIIDIITKELPQYDYQLLFIDNCSTDNTRPLIRELCRQNPKIQAIFNAKNFGQFNSPFHGMCQTTGDCTITMCCDFQDPVEMIPKFVSEWEKGYKIVCGIKTSSKENPIMYFLRSCYYKTIRKMSQVEQIEHFTGFGLYDKSFIKVLSELKDPTPFLRGIVAELGYKRKDIEYTQEQRRGGKSKNNFYSLYDAAMLSLTSYTKIGLRLATFVGFGFSFLSFIAAIVYLVLKLIHWNNFAAGQAPLLIVLLLFISLVLFFIGLLGEYVLSINQRVMNHPLVVEEERINFQNNEKGE